MRSRRRLALLLLLVAAAVAVWWSVGHGPGADAPPAAAPGSPTEVRPASAVGPLTVRRVVDGDTIIVLRDGAEERVRLLGIDTPESVQPDSPVECFGPEASARTDELLSGRSVWLEGDPTEDAVDRFGRTLAYAWLDETTLVNRVLVAEGYAHEYTYGVPGVHQAALRAAEDDARDGGLGLWSQC
ncbi:thermonuclease family protein [Cellulomonas sp. IC4_254]|uniref:thermonuclease family protein n=1 Tax=Cellulomonas sp. IC4_254 TaxID=2714040 RepID=UPI0014201B22|nr:thermonuclease family protein [Cellulomonas sp. IC4_254]NHT18489.1 nuclease [Cellulomonas sp. IC4_254]